jgi:hypothetical protein
VTVAPGFRVPHERLVSGVVAAASTYMSTFMLVTGCGEVVGADEEVGSIVPVAENPVCTVSNAAVTAVKTIATTTNATSGNTSLLLKFN